MAQWMDGWMVRDIRLSFAVKLVSDAFSCAIVVVVVVAVVVSS